jgi:hypothetical protein
MSLFPLYLPNIPCPKSLTIIVTPLLPCSDGGVQLNTPPSVGQPIQLFREWNDYADPNALSVWVKQHSAWVLLGYLTMSVTALIRQDLDHGAQVRGTILKYDPSALLLFPHITVRLEITCE